VETCSGAWTPCAAKTSMKGPAPRPSCAAIAASASAAKTSSTYLRARFGRPETVARHYDGQRLRIARLFLGPQQKTASGRPNPTRAVKARAVLGAAGREGRAVGLGRAPLLHAPGVISDDRGGESVTDSVRKYGTEGVGLSCEVTIGSSPGRTTPSARTRQAWPWALRS
jgi:hypothetical protein